MDQTATRKTESSLQDAGESLEHRGDHQAQARSASAPDDALDRVRAVVAARAAKAAAKGRASQEKQT